MTVLAVIPARAGSKRLAGKNLLPLDGRPLLAYSVLLARSTPEIDHVVVASDSTDILQVGVEAGAEILGLPANLTGDDAALIGSLRYTLATVEQCCIGKRFDWIVLLQPTSPLRLVDQCRRWIADVLAKPDCDGLLTVDQEAYKLGARTREGYYRPDYPPGIIKQQVQPRFRENGLFYVLKADNIRRGKLFGPKMFAAQCLREQSLANIDYAWDFEFTAWAYDHFGYQAQFDELERNLKGAKSNG